MFLVNMGRQISFICLVLRSSESTGMYSKESKVNVTYQDFLLTLRQGAGRGVGKLENQELAGGV